MLAGDNYVIVDTYMKCKVGKHHWVTASGEQQLTVRQPGLPLQITPSVTSAPSFAVAKKGLSFMLIWLFLCSVSRNFFSASHKPK